VTQQQFRRQETADQGPGEEQRWAELADLALIVSREIQYRGYADERALPLTQSEGMVMRHLMREESAAPSRIATATGLLRTNLSAVLRGLERKGLIERQTNSDDRRGVAVSATERGRENFDLVRREWAATVAQAAGHDATDLDAAIALLTEVKDGMIRTRPPAPSDHPTA
jgi:DNA-binding MarR family transcriptional regulator